MSDRVQCWPWTGRVDPKGYGYCHINGAHRAHRHAYILIHGAIPEELLVRHRCDNPRCCNPYHLETGTHLDNATDRKTRGRNGNNRGANNGYSKLTQEQADAIRANPEGLLQRELAARFGVSQSRISKIQLGLGW